MTVGWRSLLQRRAATPWSVLVAGIVALATVFAGLDVWHVVAAGVVVVGGGVVADVLRLGIADVAPPWVHRDALPSASGTRSDLARLAVRVTADVEGRPGDAAPETLSAARRLAAARLTRAGVVPDDAPHVLGARAAATLAADGRPRVRLKDLLAALDRLAALDDHPPPRSRPSAPVPDPTPRRTS